MAETVILGAGIIGVSTAYYLAKHQPGNTIHLIDTCPELFASASGYAAGFLTKNWFGSALAALAAVSFEEHRRLAEVHDGASKWGYSRSTAFTYTAADPNLGGNQGQRGEGQQRNGTSSAGTAVDGPDAGNVAPPWLRREHGDKVRQIGDDTTGAQVDPLQLCHFLLQQCSENGVHVLKHAKAIAILTDSRDELSSIRVADIQSSTVTVVPCTRLIITAGPWSPRVFKELFPHSRLALPITSLAGHSLVLRSPRWTKEMGTNGCHALFATSKTKFSPEIFSRLGGELYIAGVNSDKIPLPDMATEKPICRKAIRDLKGAAAKLIGAEGLEVVREGLCWRPTTRCGTPIMTRLDDEHLQGGISTRPGAAGGVFVAAGHGPWGVALSLGTGKVLAEMAQGRRLSTDVSSLAMW